MDAAEMIREVLRHGDIADDPLDDPIKARYRTNRIHDLAKQAGIKVKTKTMYVEDVGERLFVVSRIG